MTLHHHATSCISRLQPLTRLPSPCRLPWACVPSAAEGSSRGAVPTPSSTKSVLCSSDSRSVFSNSSRNDSCNPHTTPPRHLRDRPRTPPLEHTMGEARGSPPFLCPSLPFRVPSQARVCGALPRSGLSGRTCSRRPTVLSSSSSETNRSTIRRSHSRIACPTRGRGVERSKGRKVP